MNKQRNIHHLHLPLSVRDTTISSDYSQYVKNLHQQDFLINNQEHKYKTCHHHFHNNDKNQYRNNHNSDLIQYDNIEKSINNNIHRKQRSQKLPYNQNEYYYQTNEKYSLLIIYINNILLILIRLMILFIIILIICFIFYYSFSYIYSKPKINLWQFIINSFF